MIKTGARYFESLPIMSRYVPSFNMYNITMHSAYPPHNFYSDIFFEVNGKHTESAHCVYLRKSSR